MCSSKPPKNKDAIALERTTVGESELLLAIAGLDVHEGMAGIEAAVAKIVEGTAMSAVGAGLGDYVHHGAAGASQLGAVRVGGDAELLNDLVAELVGSAIAAASLGEESVVVVGPIHQITGLIYANAAEGQVAIGGRGEAARILGNAGSEQGKIAEATSIERQLADGALVNHAGDVAGLSFDKRRGFFGTGNQQLEFELSGTADLDMHGGTEL